MEVHESIARAIATAGGAVLFAGGTVAISLLALVVADIPLVTTLGYTSAIAVASPSWGAHPAAGPVRRAGRTSRRSAAVPPGPCRRGAVPLWTRWPRGSRTTAGR